MSPLPPSLAALLALPLLSLAAQQGPVWPQHSRERPPPPVAAAPALLAPVPAPPGATILFDGRDLSQWRSAGRDRPARWKLVEGNAMEVVSGTGAIETRAAFGDVHVHVEWASPVPATGEDQDRGNSGVFLMGRYEVQILDSYESRTYADGQAGAIYGQFPPRVNVTQPPGEWNSFDIEFRRPRFDASGALVAPARMTVRHNGVVIHADVALLGPTSNMMRAPYEAHADELPISLQDHGHPVRFRNIWVQPLSPAPSPPAAGDLTIATYNIRHGRGNDERVDLDRTAAAIRALDADVVALQEVDRGVARSGAADQPRLLGEQLGMEHAFGAFFPYQGGEYGMALLSRHPIRRTEALRLPDGNEPRVALFAEVELPSAKRILVVNVHFDWVQNDTLRYRQVEALAAVLDTVSLPVVLLGDFNDVPGSRTMLRWQERFVTLEKPASDRFTFSSTRPAREIDHILLAPAAAWERRSARVVTDTITSDHRAVVGEVRVR